MVRAAFRLVREIGDSSGHLRTTTIHTWTEAFRGLVERAIAEGDVRAGLDPQEVAEVLIAVAYGCPAARHRDRHPRRGGPPGG
ncbi:TetR/AcrR family transcriptional regulator C-terminal ligand-binding domain-containing protein [Rhodococcus jostii]|uniref:TetR/AcrR family transcriptional regulator C-terminal ligand-binding domain-containing protein n=1 Tax=Rhodococcus jostii TaxID=132919 RepID=UPI0036614BEE